MKKANIKDKNQYYKGFILIETLKELWDFYDEKTFGMMKNSARNLVDRDRSIKAGKTISHPTNIIVQAIEKLQKFNKKGIVYLQAEVMGSYQNDLDEIISKGDKIAINPYNMVSYFVLTSNAEFEIISLKENYTENDIKVFKWEGGTHWYAKISTIDVVVDNEQKWGAEWLALKKAKQFLNDL